MKLKQIFRRLFRDRLNTAVIIISLAVGMASINLIILFITRELNTDSFQKDAARIYMLKCDDPFNKGSQMSNCRSGAAEYMKANFAQVEDYCRIKSGGAKKIIVNEQTYDGDPDIYGVSANFFNFFSYKLLTNNPNTVLATKQDIVISEELARKYFGENTAVGQKITLVNSNSKNDYIISGIFRRPKENTMLHFDMVKLDENSEVFAFLKLKDNANPAELEKIFEKEKSKIPSINGGTPGKYYLNSLKNAYFDTVGGRHLGSVRDKADLLIAFIIGMMIIGVASFNYLGLINSKLLDNTREFNIRRINGGTKGNLVGGFMIENLIIIIIAFALSLELMSVLLPFFNSLVAADIQVMSLLRTNALLFSLGVIAFLLLVTWMFSIIKIKRQFISSTQIDWVDHDGKKIRIPAFNILQITISLVLLVGSFVIMKQINYISNKEIGIDKEVIEVKLPYKYADKLKVFREEILKNPSIELVSVASASPFLEYMVTLFNYTENGKEMEYAPSILRGDENYINTLGIRLISGRNFSGKVASDLNSCLINETMARKFPDKNLLGEKIPGNDKITIIGIVKDFNYYSLKRVIEPTIITFDTVGNHLLVKASPGRLAEARKTITQTWQRLVPDSSPNLESISERYEWYHRENTNYAKLIVSCCIISLFLSVIGLFALSFHASKKRTKEIGIRKINGATIWEVMVMLNMDFVRWVAIAFIISTPVAWYIMHKWLENFAYRTDLNWWIFALAGLLTLGIILITVSWQSWKAATSNPVEALRYE